MKFYLAVLGCVCLSVVSCKKDRTCTCTVTTNGSVSTRNQTAGTTITIPGFPPVVIVAPSDTTILSPYSFSNAEKTNYDKVSKNTMRKNCPATHEENFADRSTLVTPGTSTITNVKSEKRTTACKIE